MDPFTTLERNALRHSKRAHRAALTFVAAESCGICGDRAVVSKTVNGKVVRRCAMHPLDGSNPTLFRDPAEDALLHA